MRPSAAVWSVLLAAAAFSQVVPSGIADLERVRREVLAAPTSAQTLRERHALLFAWFRLLVHQGIDASEFEAVRNRIGRGQRADAVFRAVDEGYSLLERIQANPRRIGEIRGKPAAVRSTAATDWSMYNGGPSQTGYSPDAGPATGETAWRFPIGHSWYARPSVEAGRVYIASPGMTTLALCLDEKTGQTVWRSRQYGTRLYGTPRAASAVVVLEDRIVLRATTGSWEDEPPRHLYWLDKATGKVVLQEDAGMVDYRRGYPPLTGNGRYLAYAEGRQDIRSSPPSVSMLDTVAVRESASGRFWWKFRTGDIFGDPALEDGHVYAGTEAGTLYALRLSGSERLAWRYEAGTALRGTPAAGADSVVVAGRDGSIHAVDRTTGRQKWTFQARENEPRAFQLFSTPVLANGRVYIGSAARIVYCLDAAKGTLIWKQPVSDWVRSRPLVLGRVVYAAAMDGLVTAIEDRASGPKVLWRRRAGEHQILADLAGSGTGILVSSSGLWLYSMNPADGRIQWRQSLLDGAWINGEFVPSDPIAAGSDYQSPPTAVRGRVFVGAPNRFVYAVDAATGKEIWRFETSGQVSGSPTVAEGRVYFGQQGGDRDLYAVGENDGRPLWRRQVGWVWVTATYSEGRLYTGTVEGEILCLRAGDGAVEWRHRTNGGVYPSPATDEQQVYTGSWDGYYYALDKRSGRLEWAFARPGWPYHRGGGPDSAAPIRFDGKVLVRVVPATLAAIDPQTGRLMWEFRAPATYQINATAAAHGDRIFISAYRDLGGAPLGARLFALDTAGRQVWEYRGAGGWPGAAVTNDKVCAGSSTEPFFVCLDPQGNGSGTTRVVWRRKLGGVFEESLPAIYGDKLFVLCADRYLYAFR